MARGNGNYCKGPRSVDGSRVEKLGVSGQCWDLLPVLVAGVCMGRGKVAARCRSKD